MSIKIIDPVSGKVMFDSDDVVPEQLDSERDHITAHGNWSIQTMEQLERSIDRPFRQDCPTCEGTGSIVSLGDQMRCPTCHNKSRR